MSWSQYDSYAYLSCTPDDDPPPFDPGGGGGGGTSGAADPNTSHIYTDECAGWNEMVDRLADPNGLESGAYLASTGHLILLPSTSTGTTRHGFVPDFPYRDNQGRIILNLFEVTPSQWQIDVTDYSSGLGVIATYNIVYFVHSHPLDPGYDFDNPSPEDKLAAGGYPGMDQYIVNANSLIRYNGSGIIWFYPNPCR